MEAVQEANRKKVKRGIVSGLLLIAVGLVLTTLAGRSLARERQEPVDIYQAQEAEQYVYAPVQYMTDAIACYEAMDKMEFYMTFDEEWNPTLVCMHDEQLSLYEPYRQWFYWEGEDVPEPVLIKGYAQPIDTELKELAIQSFADQIASGYVDNDNFSNWFGEYYILIGGGSHNRWISNAGLWIMLAGVLVIVAGAVYWRWKGKGQPLITGKASRAGSILGVLLGAGIGGSLWIALESIGMVAGWTGLVIIALAYQGWLLSGGIPGRWGKGISLLAGLVVIAPATYITYGWIYYQAVNQSVAGYTSIFRAFKELPAYLDRCGQWNSVYADILQGYLFVLFAGIYWGISHFWIKRAENKQNLK